MTAISILFCFVLRFVLARANRRMDADEGELPLELETDAEAGDVKGELEADVDRGVRQRQIRYIL